MERSTRKSELELRRQQLRTSNDGDDAIRTKRTNRSRKMSKGIRMNEAKHEAMKNLLELGMTTRQVANVFGCSLTTVQLVKRTKSYAELRGIRQQWMDDHKTRQADGDKPMEPQSLWPQTEEDAGVKAIKTLADILGIRITIEADK